MLTTSRCSRARSTSDGIDRLRPSRVDHGDADALGDQPLGDVDRGGRHRAVRHDQHVVGAVADQDVAPAAPPDGLDVGGRGALGEPDHGRRVGDLDGLVEQLAQAGRVARRGEPQPGHDLEDGHVPHAVVAGAVVAGDAGPVEHERDAAPVQGDVHQHLVEGPVEERRVQRHHRVQPGHGQAGGRRHGVLLGDADVERAVGELGLEVVQPDRMHHRRGDRDHVGPPVAEVHHLVGEHVGPDPLTRVLDAAVDVERAGAVELVGLVQLGRVVAEALARDRVHDHRPVEALRLGQHLLHRRTVVAVDRADVLQAEVLEQALWREGVLEALLHGVQRVVRRGTDAGDRVEAPLHLVEQLLVARVGPQAGERRGQATDRRRVGAAVVVDDDDELALLGDRDVVERLPGHPAGQRAVADDGNDVTVLAADRVGLGEAVGVGQGGGGVGVLDDVVLGLRLARVAADAALLTELLEARHPAGQQLVHIGLVAGVEDDAVARRVEDPVDRHRQLDHAEVRSDVATGPRAGPHEEVADLGGQLVELGSRQAPQVARGRDLLQ